MMNSFSQISIFVEVINQQGFAAAAKHLKISPAAVSKQISALENRLGIQLLKRSTRRITLTPEGAMYYEHCKRVLETLKEADAAISQVKEEPSGTLKVICGPHFGNQYLLPNLKEFIERYPHLKLVIELTQKIPDLDKEKVDVILGLSSSIPENCIQRRLLFARNLLCASPKYLKQYGIPKKPADLVNHRIIAHSMSNPTNILTFTKGTEILFEPIVYINDTRAMKKAAIEGIGIVELHNYIVEDELKNGTLIEILTKYKEQKNTIPLYVAYPQTDFVHIKVRRFIDFILEKL